MGPVFGGNRRLEVRGADQGGVAGEVGGRGGEGGEGGAVRGQTCDFAAPFDTAFVVRRYLILLAVCHAPAHLGTHRHHFRSTVTTTKQRQHGPPTHVEELCVLAFVGRLFTFTCFDSHSGQSTS